MKVNNSYFLVLDIETSSEFRYELLPTGEKELKPIAVWLSYGYCNFYKSNGEKVKDNYFRTWDELSQILYYYSLRCFNYSLICFVHNLSYEFDFLIKNISKPIKILSNSSHKPILAKLERYKNIEFRCTYLLSGYSLAKIGEMVCLSKLNSEYRTIYPCDQVTQQEKDYCIRDCDIVAAYIKSLLIEYSFLSNLPYTKTGRVRKTMKMFYENDRNKKDWDLMPPEDCYSAMQDAFAGGLCIVNPQFVGKVINNVKCYDETSAYPYAALLESFPYTISREYDSKKFDLSKNFWIAKIKFYGISSKYGWGCLSASKMNDYSIDALFFNGKLLEANMIERTITNIDFNIIKEVYNVEKIDIIEFYNLDNYGKLPEPIINTFIKYGELKGILKDKIKQDDVLHELTEEQRKDLERDYILSKNDFNGIYGMMVQKIVNSEFSIDDNFEWKEITKPYKQEKRHLKRNFLFGIYITAYARRNLIRAIIKNCPYTFIYGDTDSIKCIIEREFIDTNDQLVEYENNKYLQKIGKFDYEGIYTKFKTFGAKKYAFSHGGPIELVVAGLPKTVGKIESMDEFRVGKLFANCKLGTKYFYKDIAYEYGEDEVTVINESYSDETSKFLGKHNIKSNGGVILYPTSYLLSISDNDRNYLKTIEGGYFTQWLKNVLLLTGIDLTKYIDTTHQHI